MFRKILHIVASVLIFTGILSAQADSFSRAADKTTGLGVIVGEPTGFTGKFWLNQQSAFDVGLAFSFSDFVLMYGDYLYHFHGVFGTSTPFLQQLQPYIGVGGELFISEDSHRTDGDYYTNNGDSVGLGLRIPFGAEWLAPSAPLGVFVELVPGVGIVPSTFGFFQGGLGVRYYF